MRPDAAAALRAREAERGRLAALAAAMTPAQAEAIRARSAALQERQRTDDDPELLPKVTLADVPATIPVITGDDVQLAGFATRRYTRGTNGIVHLQVVVPLPELAIDDIIWLPYLSEYLTEVGSGTTDYLAAQRRRADIGRFEAYITARPDIAEPGQLRGFFVIAGRALARKSAALSDELFALFDAARFDEHDYLAELIAQSYAETQASVTDRGHVLAMYAASATLSAHGWLDETWDGVSSLRELRQLDERVREGHEPGAFGACRFDFRQ